MSKLKNNIMRNKTKVAKVASAIWCFLLMTAMFSMTVYADTGTIDKFIEFVCEWLIKIGAVVMMVGGVCFGLAERGCRRKNKRSANTDGRCNGNSNRSITINLWFIKIKDSDIIYVAIL